MKELPDFFQVEGTTYLLIFGGESSLVNRRTFSKKLKRYIISTLCFELDSLMVRTPDFII